MEKKGYRLFKGDGEVNIIHVEGMFPEGIINEDKNDQFNAARILITFVDQNGQKIPVILGSWHASVKTGRHYIDHPVPGTPTAKIMPGQYAAWRVGEHYGSLETPFKHQALVQDGNVRIWRDTAEPRGVWNGQDFSTSGKFDLNIHFGNVPPPTKKGEKMFVGKGSRGCPIGLSYGGHLDFMNYVTRDVKYQKDKNFMFTATFLEGRELFQFFQNAK